MQRNPLGATAVVVLFLIAVPVALMYRFAENSFTLRAVDIPLAFAIGAWLCIAKAIMDRPDVLDSLTQGRVSPRWQAHALVEQSLFGVGLVGPNAFEADEPNRLWRIATPQSLTIDQLPPAEPDPELARARRDFDEDGPRRSIPTLRTEEPASPAYLATEEYLVQRRDTFWSITEQVLGDGRHWKSIQELNLDREVAPGVFLAESDELGIGWSILIPLTAAESTDDENA